MERVSLRRRTPCWLGRVVVVLVVVCLAVVQWATLEAAGSLPPPAQGPQQVTSLPGWTGPLGTNQYTGYLTANSTSGAQLFFWFVESQGNPATDPLVLWLNGGPGCSSLLGLLSENGPYILQPDGMTLEANPWSWNRVANMLYLEAPSGVGFSYSQNGDYVTGDNDTAAGNYQALLGFFQGMPQYRSNPFYVAGESFAGYYVPQLTYAIVQGNADLSEDEQINLKGFAVGNPSFDFTIEGNAYFEFMAQHGLVAEEDFLAANATCQGVFYPPPNQECAWVVGNLTQINFGLINPYNIYQDCGGDGASPDGGCFTTQLASVFSAVRASDNNVQSIHTSPMPMSQTFIPCLNYTYLSDYLNRPDVKAALHISNSSLPWYPCSPYIQYVQFNPTMYPFYNALLNLGTLRAMVYSGDVDSCVPYLGTERCVRGLGLEVIQSWRPWTITDSNNMPQTAGYYIAFDKSLTYVTVKGAGHMVPMYKPQQAFTMFQNFLE